MSITLSVIGGTQNSVLGSNRARQTSKRKGSVNLLLFIRNTGINSPLWFNTEISSLRRKLIIGKAVVEWKETEISECSSNGIKKQKTKYFTAQNRQRILSTLMYANNHS